MQRCFYVLIMLLSITLSSQVQSADLIIFSKDRPLQLEALLSSLALHVEGLTSISVLFATSTDLFDTGYRQLMQQFPGIRWVQQDRSRNRADFHGALHHIIATTSADYLIFAVDDMVVTNAIDVLFCIKMLQRANAYGCYFRLGKDINYCYAYNCPMRIPELQHLGTRFYSWTLNTAEKCWGYAHTVDMTLYPRQTALEALQVQACSPNTFEAMWACKGLAPHTQGICYETSRVINIPLNLVQQDYRNRCSQQYTPEQLLELFLNGWRIDIYKLRNLPHNSPHVDIDIPLVHTTRQPCSL